MPPGPDLAASIAEQLGTHLGSRYRIEGELGQGGMAVVYLAHDFKLNRSVAIKVMRPDIGSMLGAPRFLREIHIAAKLNHPGIIALYDSGEAGGLLFYVMPYEAGQTLRQRLEAGRLPVGEALRIGQEVADALAYAHENEVVHRDIKPENILLLPHGHAVIADFGIARALAGVDAGITTTSVRVGSPQYMSPEQFIAGGEIGPRTDVYALGCVVFEMLTGSAPYRGADFETLMSLHCTAPIPSTRTARSGVPLAVDMAVRRALAKSPAERYRSASDFGVALGARRIEPTAVVRELVRGARRRGGAIAVAVLLAAAAAAALVVRGHAHAGGSSQPSVAVPRFAVVNPDLAPQALSLAATLNSDLASVSGLGVVSSAELRATPDTAPRQLAARFGVTHVVIGTLLGRNPLRVRVRVVDAGSGVPVKDTTVAREDGAALATALGTEVRRALGRLRDSVATRARFRSDSAWHLVQLSGQKMEAVEGAFLVGAYRQGRQSMAEAESLISAAAAMEGGSAAGRMALAERRDRQAFVIEFVRQARPDSAGALGDPLAVHLSALPPLDSLVRSNPGHAAALRLRAYIKLAILRTGGADSLLASATIDAERAGRLDPSLPGAWLVLADCWSDSGVIDEELFALQRADAADVFRQHRDQYLRGTFDASLRAGQAWRAEPACLEAQREFPDNERFADCELKLLAYTAATGVQAARALQIADSLILRSENATEVAMWRVFAAQALARVGRAADARRQLQLLWSRTPADALPPFILTEAAVIHLLLHDRAAALDLLRRGIAADPKARRRVLSDPRFAPLSGLLRA